MSLERVKQYLEQSGLESRMTVYPGTIDTVEHAAEMAGCERGRVAKTMSFLVNGCPVLIVLSGDVKIDNAKFKNHFRVKAKMIPFEHVGELIGYMPGGVCPYAVNDGVKTYLDVSLKRFPDVHTGGGSETCLVHLTIEELEAQAKSCGWIDVCKEI